MKFKQLLRMRALLFVMAFFLFSSCEKTFEYKIQDDVLYNYLQPTQVDNMESEVTACIMQVILAN